VVEAILALLLGALDEVTHETPVAGDCVGATTLRAPEPHSAHDGSHEPADES
jgi:hypothetical protein